MEEVDPRARVRKAGVDSEEADPGGADHPLAASVCQSQDRWEEPGRQSGLQGPWLGLRSPEGSQRPEAPESPLGRSIRLVVLVVEGRSSASACQPAASPSWHCSRLQC